MAYSRDLEQKRIQYRQVGYSYAIVAGGEVVAGVCPMHSSYMLIWFQLFMQFCYHYNHRPPNSVDGGTPSPDDQIPIDMTAPNLLLLPKSGGKWVPLPPALQAPVRPSQQQPIASRDSGPYGFQAFTF